MLRGFIAEKTNYNYQYCAQIVYVAIKYAKSKNDRIKIKDSRGHTLQVTHLFLLEQKYADEMGLVSSLTYRKS